MPVLAWIRTFVMCVVVSFWLHPIAVMLIRGYVSDWIVRESFPSVERWLYVQLMSAGNTHWLLLYVDTLKTPSA